MCVRARVYVCVCVWVRVCACMCVCAGITSYAWAEGGPETGKILVPIGNELFVQEGLNGSVCVCECVCVFF